MSRQECPTLTEALETAGINKTRLAELLNVNRKTVQRMGDELTPDVQAVLSKIPKTEPTIPRTVSGTTEKYAEAIKVQPYDMLAPIKWHPEINQKIFDGHGRGVPVDGFVLISMGRVADNMPECQVVAETDWMTRLAHKCDHSYKGWTCKPCLY